MCQEGGIWNFPWKINLIGEDALTSPTENIAWNRKCEKFCSGWSIGFLKDIIENYTEKKMGRDQILKSHVKSLDFHKDTIRNYWNVLKLENDMIWPVPK